MGWTRGRANRTQQIDIHFVSMLQNPLLLLSSETITQEERLCRKPDFYTTLYFKPFVTSICVLTESARMSFILSMVRIVFRSPREKGFYLA